MAMKRLGTLLKRFRTNGTGVYYSYGEDHMTCAQLAKQIGVSKPTLTRIETGKSVDGDTMVKLMLWLFEKGNAKPKAENKKKR